MSAGAPTRGRAVRGNFAAPATHALSASESAWLAALPCALLTVAAIVVLGPPFGRTLFAPPANTTIWAPFFSSHIAAPEPTEHARYVIALLGPLLAGGGVLALAGRRVRTSAATTLATIAQIVLLAVVAAGVVAQQQHVYDSRYTSRRDVHEIIALLTPATLVAAVALALLTALALSRRGLVAGAARALRETPVKRAAVNAVAVAFVLLWLLSAFNTDATIERANQNVSYSVAFWTDEAFAILNGHAPLVDFHAQYGQLWAYLAAGGMKLVGTSLAAYAAIMLAGTAGALAAVFATFRRLAGGAPAALALFLPFVATSFFMEVGPLSNRYGPANLFSLFPIRYGGPYVLLWLVVRRVQRGAARAPFALFAFAGVVAINNLEFGLPALAATLLALVAAMPDRSARALARIGGAALTGLAAAVALVCALTLAVSGSLPHFSLLLTFPRIYGAEGFGMLPMPALGLHLALYATFAAAIVVAIVRIVARERDATLTSALSWTGIFGLSAGAYFAGRSHPDVLVDLFSIWALALTLLLLVVVRAILSRPSRRPQLAELLVLAGIGVAVCSLPQTPTPWSQLARLQRTQPRSEQVARLATRVVARLTHRGEPVALLLPLGHRIAYQLGLDDVTPYTNMEAMMTRDQWHETINALRHAGGRQVIAPRVQLFPERIEYLRAAGYQPEREAAGLGIVDFVAR